MVDEERKAKYAADREKADAEWEQLNKEEQECKSKSPAEKSEARKEFWAHFHEHVNETKERDRAKEDEEREAYKAAWADNNARVREFFRSEKEEVATLREEEAAAREAYAAEKSKPKEVPAKKEEKVYGSTTLTAQEISEGKARNAEAARANAAQRKAMDDSCNARKGQKEVLFTEGQEIVPGTGRLTPKQKKLAEKNQ